MAENIRRDIVKGTNGQNRVTMECYKEQMDKGQVTEGFVQPAPVCSLPKSQTLDRSPEVSDLSE